MPTPDPETRPLRLYWYWPFPSVGRNLLAEALGARGHDLTVESLATRFGEPVEQVAVGYGARRDLPEVAARRERSAAWLADRARVYLARARLRDATIRAGGFDVAHLHSLNRFTDPVALARLRRRVPVVASVHDVLPHQRRVPDVVERALPRLLYRQCSVLVVAHEVLADRLALDYGIDRDRICVVPILIEGMDDDPAPAPPGESGAAGPVRVLCFGVLRRNKGIAELVAAVAGLDPSTIELTIAGRGTDDMEALVRDAARDHPAIRAEVGYVDDARKRELFRGADLVVLPYTSMHSQSAVLADAYAHRVPVVVTDVGAVGAAVRADRTGWVVPPGDVAALRDALCTAAADVDGRRTRAARVAEVARGHSLDAVTDGYLAAYARALAPDAR